MDGRCTNTSPSPWGARTSSLRWRAPGWHRWPRRRRSRRPGPPRSRPVAGEPILIVDDNPTNLKLARVVLAAEGYEVRVAVDAEEALALLDSFHPRLILMDLQLPGMDGLTLTRRLKGDPATSDVSILAL